VHAALIDVAAAAVACLEREPLDCGRGQHPEDAQAPDDF
jgi:hypothetical protein